jgi:predicted aspartyl protease
MDTSKLLGWRLWKQTVTVMAVVLLVSLSSSSCFGSTEAEEQASSRVEIPFALYNGNLVIVKATVGSVRNVNMILDTGTSPSAISKEMADQLRLPGKEETLLTLKGSIPARSVLLPRIEIGPLHAESTKVLVQDLGFMERSLGISLGGIAGLDVLSTGSFTIDYQRRKIIFGPIPASVKMLPFATTVPFLSVRARIGGQEVRLLVDSGTWGLLVYRDRLQVRREQLRLDANASISTVGGMTRVSWLRTPVSLGKDDLGVREVAVADADSDPQDGFDGLLGFARMGFRRVSFDFERGMFGWE